MLIGNIFYDAFFIQKRLCEKNTMSNLAVLFMRLIKLCPVNELDFFFKRQINQIITKICIFFYISLTN